MRLLNKTPLLIGISALFAAVALTSCEDDPILAPQSGGQKTNGSYGNIAIAPPVDTTDSQPASASRPINPEVY